MTTIPADTMTSKLKPIIELHIEGLITTEELNNIINRIIKKYEVKQ